MSHQEEVQQKPRRERRVDIHISGTNHSGKTMMAVAMMNTLAKLGIENIRFVNPEHTPDQIKELEAIAPQTIAEHLTDVNVTFHEFFGNIDINQLPHAASVQAVRDVLNKLQDFLESPHNDDSVTRQGLIADIKRVTGQV